MDEKCLEDRTTNTGRSSTLYEDEKPAADIDVDRIRACCPHLRSYTAAHADVYPRNSLDRLAPGNGSSDCMKTQVPGLKDIPELDNDTDLTKEWTICSMAYRTRSQHSLTPVYTDEMHHSAFLSLCNLASSSWTLGAAECSHHSHYRLIINDIGRSLASFCCTKEVVQAIADARTAHERAFHTAGITHRSISAGNILIASDGTGGLLVDWDMSLCLLDDRETPRTRQLRMGMWQFMSIKLLRERPADQEDCELLANDMESLFWVLLYVILRFFPQKELPPATVRNQVKRIFEEVLWLSSLDDIQGGRNKLDFLHHLVLEHQLAKYNFIYKLPAHIQNILRSLAAIFHDFYFGSHSPADIDELQKAEVIYPKLDREFRAMLSTDDWSNHETENTFDLFARHSEEELSS